MNGLNVPSKVKAGNGAEVSAFDYRRIGESERQPRQVLSVRVATDSGLS